MVCWAADSGFPPARQSAVPQRRCPLPLPLRPQQFPCSRSDGGPHEAVAPWAWRSNNHNHAVDSDKDGRVHECVLCVTSTSHPQTSSFRSENGTHASTKADSQMCDHSLAQSIGSLACVWFGIPSSSRVHLLRLMPRHHLYWRTRIQPP